jgi:acyl-CoA synthetase (AMP-forming)/AMP-acid ligase II
MPNFSELLRERYESGPERISVVLQTPHQADRAISYAELIHGSVGYAHSLERNGVQPGEVVILILEHGIDLLYAYFGTCLQGAIPSIMPFLTEKLLPERYRADLAALVEVTRPSAIITFPGFAGEVKAALHPGRDSVRAVILCTEADGPERPVFPHLPGFQRRPEEIALLQHSSGTTGLQKGVALSHQAVCNQLVYYSQALRLQSHDVFVSWLPLYHDMGLIACWLMPILLGNRLIWMSPFEWVRAPHRLLQAVSKYQGTLSWLPNFAYNFCAQKIRDRDLEGVDLSTWRAVSNCSEPMRWESHQAFYDRFRVQGLRKEALTTCYAMAENVFAVSQGGISRPVTCLEIDRESLQAENQARPALPGRDMVRMLSAGSPLQNTRVCILDLSGEPLPERAVGEIALQSDCMLSEYYHRPDATRKAFQHGWYLTGDLGFLVDGELYITGRKKDLIIVAGKNIYPQDIEALAYEVPGVHAGRASAFGLFNETTGTEEVALVAEVEEKDPGSRREIADAIRRTVTRGSAVTLRDVYLVGPHWLVKTSSGKTARGANREKYLLEIQRKDLPC